MSSTNRDASVASNHRGRGDDKVKVAKPDYFYGDRHKLDNWLNQVLLYFRMEEVGAEKQPLTAASYLRGEAEQWIRPRLTEKLLRNNDPDGLFSSFHAFVMGIRSIYGVSNNQQVAIRQIQHVTQKASASQYTAKFTEYATATGWDDNALRTMYYRGLKDNVKDELMRNRQDQASLIDLMKAAIDVDDKLYERAMEKKHNQNIGRSGYATNGWTGGQRRRDPDAMEIDNTQERPKHQGRGGRHTKGNHQAQGKKREGLKCYNCQKTGHYARDCRGRKVQPQQRKAEFQPYEVNVMTKTENKSPIVTTCDEHDAVAKKDHASLHWTFCYEDSCTTHWSCKSGSGYFPSAPRRQRMELNATQTHSTLWDSIMYEEDNSDVSVLRLPSPHQERDDGHHARGRSPPPFRREEATLHETQEVSSEEESNYEESNQDVPVQQPTSQITMTNTEDLGVIPEIEDSDAGESTPEDSEEEYSDDDAPGDNELLHFTVDGPEPIRRMILHIARRFEEIFPEIQGKRRLHASEFEQTLAQLKAMFWDYRQISSDHENHSYVQEVVPMGSIFKPGGYTTPNGIYISRQMRERVMLLNQRYKEIERMQIQWHDEEITETEMRRRYAMHIPQWSIPPLMPAHGPQPFWINRIFKNVEVRTRGLVSTIQVDGRVTFRPKDGPLCWEIRLEDMKTSAQSKN